MKIPTLQRCVLKTVAWASTTDSDSEIPKGVRSKKKSIELPDFRSIVMWVPPISLVETLPMDTDSGTGLRYGRLDMPNSNVVTANVGYSYLVDIYELGRACSSGCRCRSSIGYRLGGPSFLDLRYHRGSLFGGAYIWVYFKRRNHVLKDESAATFFDYSRLEKFGMQYTSLLYPVNTSVNLSTFTSFKMGWFVCWELVVDVFRSFE